MNEARVRASARIVARSGLVSALYVFWLRYGLVRLLVRRGLAAVGLCFGVTLVAFVLTHVVPGDPVVANLGLKAMSNPTTVAAYRSEYGLDRPLPIQYELYLSHLIRGDLGISQFTHRPVATDLRQFVPASFELGVLALVFAAAFGVPLGLVAAIEKGSATDQILGLVSVTGLSVPSFWISLMMLFMFTFVFQLAPGSGRLSPGALPPFQVTGMYTVDSLLAGDLSTFGDAIHHLVLPALVMAIGCGGVLLRFTRSAVLEVIQNDYVTAARAKGLPRGQILLRYTLRAALTPILTLSGLLFADLVTGAVLVETVFAYPGVGLYAARTAINLDLSAITGVCLFVAIVYVLTNLAVDLLHAVVDPRVRLA